MGDWVAFFLDFENLHLSAQQSLHEYIQWQKVIEAVREMGPLSIQRAYGNWALYPEAQKPLLNAGFELIHTPDYRGEKKGGFDTRMIVDAAVLGIQPHIGTVVLGTGDSDFIDVVYHLRNHGKRVVALAVQANTSHYLTQAVSRFIPYESLVTSSENDTPPPPPTSQVNLEEEAQDYLRALSQKVRMTPSPQRPAALLAFYPYLKKHGGSQSFKAIQQRFQEDMRREGRFDEALLQSLPHQVFHAYALLFEEGNGASLWDRVVHLRSEIKSAREFLDWCDMGLTLWIAKGLGDINRLQPMPLAKVLYADTSPPLVERAARVLEIARQTWPDWPPRNGG